MKKVYSVYDKKAMFFSSPIIVDYPVQAERAFAQEISNTNSQLHHYAEDYAMYQIGEFDEEKGTLIPLDIPLHFHEALEYFNYKTKQEKDEAFADAFYNHDEKK